MRKVLLTSEDISNIYISLHTNNMDPAFMLPALDLANRFAMEDLNMAFARELHYDGKPLPKTLFLDVMVEKTQKLIEHINHHHLRLSLTAHIGENLAIIKMYDNYATVHSQLLHVTISNLSDLENQLWRLYIEVNGVMHDFIPHLEDIPPLKDIPTEDS